MNSKTELVSPRTASTRVDGRGLFGKLVRKLLVTRTDSLSVQFFRYGVVGGIAFVVDFSSLVILTSAAHVHYLWSAGIAFVLGLTTNYTLSVSWVFSSRTFASKYAEFGVFAWIGTIGLGLNELFMWLFTDRCGLHYTKSKLIATALVFLWNFTSRKVILFRRQ